MVRKLKSIVENFDQRFIIVGKIFLAGVEKRLNVYNYMLKIYKYYFEIMIL